MTGRQPRFNALFNDGDNLNGGDNLGSNRLFS